MFTRPQLDPQSNVPLYRQLSAYLKNLILSGRLQRGERLPATRQLAGLLGLNRATVSAAYGLLESEGLIKGHVGRGSFVCEEAAPASAGLDWDELLEASDRAAAEPAPTLTAGEESISFATSRPSEQLFPLEEFRATCREVTGGGQAGAILQLGSPSGYAPLREYLLEESRRWGVARQHDDVIITNGCQQALDLIQRVLIRPGDTVVVEDPVYPGLRNVFARSGARLVGVPVGPEGLDVEHLDRVLAREKTRLLVVTPNFQNPTGATIPLSARLAILARAREAGVVLVENDIYGQLRYEGETLPTLKQLDESGDTVLLRSFSKIAFPGLRVGWVTGPRTLLLRLAETKQWTDLHTDQLSQAVLLRFVESGRLAAHRDRILAAGAERLSAVLAACQRHLPRGSRYTRPQGGMNLWVRLPEPLDAGSLLERARRENVTYLPGKYFEVTHHEPGGLRLSFAGLEPEKIRAGMAILGEIFSSELQRARGLRRFEPVPAMV
jgi:DNA-binding transcriptional MocR family regulator